MSKPGISSIPPVALLHCGGGMDNGAEKYGLTNWREHEVSASVYYNAAFRHLAAWWDGEQTASDSGVHHLGHVMACCAILLDAEHMDQLNDDRPAIPGPFAAVVKAMTRALAIDIERDTPEWARKLERLRASAVPLDDLNPAPAAYPDFQDEVHSSALQTYLDSKTVEILDKFRNRKSAPACFGFLNAHGDTVAVPVRSDIQVGHLDAMIQKYTHRGMSEARQGQVLWFPRAYRQPESLGLRPEQPDPTGLLPGGGKSRSR
jgi:hypothetical protein